MIETRSIPEPSGALSLAGLKAHIIRNNLQGKNKRFVAVISGGNMNFGRLRFVAERAELGERREVLMSVQVPEKPGRSVYPNLITRTKTDTPVSSNSTTYSIIGSLPSSRTECHKATQVTSSAHSSSVHHPRQHPVLLRPNVRKKSET
jgi:threonine dehydratase